MVGKLCDNFTCSYSTLLLGWVTVLQMAGSISGVGPWSPAPEGAEQTLRANYCVCLF